MKKATVFWPIHDNPVVFNYVTAAWNSYYERETKPDYFIIKEMSKVLTSKRYKRIPDPGSDLNASPDAGIPPNTTPPFSPFDSISCITYSQMNIVNEMRHLWLQMIIWTRAYINNRRSRQGAVPATYERLYSIPAAFYTYLNLFFGKAIAEQFINLLSQYIIIFADLINAMITGNRQAANSSQSAWYGNVNSIAEFLVQINGSWNVNQWTDLLNRMMTMLIDEAIAILSSDYRREIAIYDRLQYQSLLIADYMSKGLMDSLLGNVNNRLE